MTLIVNNMDLSGLFGGALPQFGYEKVMGPNGGVSQNGTQIVDMVSAKATAVFKSGLLTEEQFRQVLSVARTGTASVIYDSPELDGGTVERVMIPTVTAGQRITLLGGGYAYKGVQLSLREK